MLISESPEQRLELYVKVAPPVKSYTARAQNHVNHHLSCSEAEFCRSFDTKTSSSIIVNSQTTHKTSKDLSYKK